MIEGKGHLKPLLGLLVCHEPRPSIVDQHIQAVIAPLEFGGQIPNLGLVRQVCHQEINRRVLSAVYHILNCGFSLVLIPACNHHRHAMSCQAKRRCPADSGSCAGRKADLPGH